jgi:hypothetical protein
MVHNLINYRGRSSAGRAPALQAGGREFESRRLHQIKINNSHVLCELFF